MKNKIMKFEGIDYDFRPKSYFSDLEDIEHLLLKNIKGEFRRREIKRAIKDGTYDELPDMIREAQLSKNVIKMVSNLNPSFMGGEYLPDYNPFEVEIARIILDSVTWDVISIRARPEGNVIHYRIVDEYDDLDPDLPFETSKRPLSLYQLIRLISNAYIQKAEHYLPWAFTRCNIDCLDRSDDPWNFRDFVTIDSEYYSDLSDHYYKEIAEQFPLWVARWLKNNNQKVQSHE